MSTVALDIGVLLSDSRFRGIGRYAHDLARGLGATGAAATVDPEDHQAIAEAITTLLDSTEQRRRLQSAGLQRERQFSIERMAAATREVYRATVG